MRQPAVITISSEDTSALKTALTRIWKQRGWIAAGSAFQRSNSGAGRDWSLELRFEAASGTALVVLIALSIRGLSF
jgi:hypothetical protein